MIGFPGYIALVPCLGTALVLAAGHDGASVGGKLISSAPFQFFGNLSYPLYLWHWPLLVFARHAVGGDLSTIMAVSMVAAAILLSWLSYQYVERRFVGGLPRLPVLPLGSGAIGGFAVIGTAIFLTGGIEQRFSPKSLEISNARRDFSPRRADCHFDGSAVMAYGSTCVLGTGDASVAVWGDSHGVELAFALAEELAPEERAVRQISSSACPPAVGYQSLGRSRCAAQNEASLRGLVADEAVRTVIMVAAMESYGPSHSDMIGSGMEEAAKILLAAGTAVTIVGPIHNQAYDPPSALSIIANRHSDLVEWGRPRPIVDRDLAPYRIIAARISQRTGAAAFDPTPVLCSGTLCPGYDPAYGVLYFNSSHLSMAGARKLAAALAPKI
jgi:hypothetical protein